jgi:hypothetical protein
MGHDGRVDEADHARILRSDLIAVKAGDPRGNPAFRHPTRQHAVVAGASGYLMHGYIHCRPGADAMVDLGRRQPMIPLTDASIVYDTTTGSRRDHASTLIVNRDLADWIRPAKQDDLARLSVPH